jgi:UDP-N-acetyl-D-glucosamine dehydrogenase
VGLLAKIDQRSARVAVMGLGYVGLPLAVALAEAGFPVVGIDVDRERVEAIRSGRSYIRDVPSAQLAAQVKAGRLKSTLDEGELGRADIIVICVPSPLQATKVPDLSFILAAAHQIAAHLQRGQLVILQSTTYPGTTEEDVLPILESSGLKGGVDFHLAFSPERINPGDREHTVANTPKVVGGLSPTCTELTRRLLAAIYHQVYPVSSPRAAEMSKLLENTFRAVNIALVNELAMLCERMGMDIWEVIAAASTKPFGFMAFYPGAGVGGHCIPVDPFFLSWKARAYDFHTKFIELAAEVNESMPYHTVQRVVEALNSQRKSLQGAKVFLMGVTYKKDVEDIRNSPAARIIQLLLRGGAEVSYHDPYVPRFPVGDEGPSQPRTILESVPLSGGPLPSMDCLLIITPHSNCELRGVIEMAPVVVDTCNATQGLEGVAGKVFRLGASAP